MDRALWGGALIALLAGCSGGGGGSGGIPSGPAPYVKPARAHSHGDPTALEQESLELLQRARRDPAAEGRILIAEPSAQDAIAYYAVDTGALVAQFESYSAMPPLAFDERLLASARRHAADMASNGFQGHTGSDGSSMRNRFDAVGYEGAAAENVFAYAESAVHAHASFLIDWGVEGLGHRVNALDLDGHGYRDVGVGIIDATHADVGPLALVHDFGVPPQTLNPTPNPGDPTTYYLPNDIFVVGVVYSDLDRDGFYDPGEGVAGQQMVPERGESYATTSASGGYAIPFPIDFGPVVVQWQDSDGRVRGQTELSLAQQNVELDFVVSTDSQ